jgi:hypothetical protein
MTPEQHRVGDEAKALVVAALRLAGVVADNGTLARVLPLVETALADGPRLCRAAGAAFEPSAHP